MEEQEFLDATGAAEVLGVSLQWVHQKSAAGAFPADVCFRIGHALRFDRGALVQWIRDGNAATDKPIGRPKIKEGSKNSEQTD